MVRCVARSVPTLNTQNWTAASPAAHMRHAVAPIEEKPPDAHRWHDAIVLPAGAVE